MMIIYNNLFTHNLINLKKPVIYRSQKKSNKLSSQNGELGKFLNILYSNSAEYTINYNFHNSLNMFNYTHATSPIRRIVDLINQSILYDDLYLLNKFSLEIVNNYSKKIKKLNRKSNKIKKAKNVYEQNIISIRGYVYDFDGEKIDIYLPKYKFNIRQRLINKKIRDKFTLEKDDDDL